MSKTLTLELKVTVTYNIEGELDKGLCKGYLDCIPRFIANAGLFTGDSHLTVEVWGHEVKEIK